MQFAARGVAISSRLSGFTGTASVLTVALTLMNAAEVKKQGTVQGVKFRIKRLFGKNCMLIIDQLLVGTLSQSTS